MNLKFFKSFLAIAVAAATLSVVSQAVLADEDSLGPIIVGGGAGGSEFSIEFVRLILPSVVGDCWSFSCGLDASILERLQPIAERALHPPGARFADSHELGSRLFNYNPAQNVATFNQDLLWLDSQHTVAYGAAQAAKLWIEILALGTSVQVADLERLQAALPASLRVERQSQFYEGQGEFESLLWKREAVFDRLYVSGPALDMLDLTELINLQLGCGVEALGARQFFSPTWISAAPSSEQDAAGPMRIVFKLSFGAKWKCGTQSRIGSGNAILTASRTGGEKMKFETKSVEIEIGD